MSTKRINFVEYYITCAAVAFFLSLWHGRKGRGLYIMAAALSCDDCCMTCAE